MIDGHAVDAVVGHPRINSLGKTASEQGRVDAFARDIARWLVGRPRSELGALARVITLVLRRSLRHTRLLCRDRPLLAVESAARMVHALWPLLRGEGPAPEALAPEEAPPEDEGDEGDEGDGAALPGESEEEGGSAESTDEGEPADQDGGGTSASVGVTAGSGEGTLERMDVPESVDPADVLAQLADLGDDGVGPELRALAETLRDALAPGADSDDVGLAAADILEGAGEQASRGALETDQATRTLERFVPGIGWSDAPQEIEQTLLKRLDGLVALLDKLPDLRRIAEALGRVEDATRRAGRKAGGREEVVGVRLGGDPSTVLPSELALLGDATTEDLFYQRLLERRLVSLELTGTGDEGRSQGERRGPVIACIDTSASMQGAPELAAKALVLAVTRRVLRRGRTVHLLLFGGAGERTEIRLKRGLGGLEGLLEFLESSFHAGTDFDAPLLRALDLLQDQQLEDADVLVVTDGLCRATPSVIERVEEVRQETHMRVWSVVLGRSDVRGVVPFSDQVWALVPGEDTDGAELLQRF